MVRECRPPECELSRSPRPASRRCPRATHTPTTALALRDPRFRSFCPRPAIVRHDPGLAASPPVRYRLKLERSVYSSLPLYGLGGDLPERGLPCRLDRRQLRDAANSGTGCRSLIWLLLRFAGMMTG